MASFKQAGAIHRIMRNITSHTPRPAYAKKTTPERLLKEGLFLIDQSHNQNITQLYDFHTRHLIRIRDLHNQGLPVKDISGQLSDLRKTLATLSFKLCLKNENADLALLMGGSVIKGDHTFLTDIDLIIIPASDQDRPAAKRVEDLMRKTLEKVGLDADHIMLEQFDALPLNSTSINRYALEPMPNKYEGFLESWDGKVWAAWGIFFRFLTDTQVIATSNPEGSAVQAHLEEIQDFIYSRPDAMLDLCRSQYELTLKKEKKPAEEKDFSVKNHALKPFYYSLYALKVVLGIKESSLWRTLEKAQAKKLISETAKNKASESLKFFLAIRHSIGLSEKESLDTSVITPGILANLCRERGLTEEDFLRQIETHSQNLRDISAGIFNKLAEESETKN